MGAQATVARGEPTPSVGDTLKPELDGPRHTKKIFRRCEKKRKKMGAVVFGLAEKPPSSHPLPYMSVAYMEPSRNLTVKVAHPRPLVCPSAQVQPGWMCKTKTKPVSPRAHPNTSENKSRQVFQRDPRYDQPPDAKPPRALPALPEFRPVTPEPSERTKLRRWLKVIAKYTHT